MRAPSASCSWLKRTSFGDTAVVSFTGTLTSPKLIEPLQIERGASASASRVANADRINSTPMPDAMGPIEGRCGRRTMFAQNRHRHRQDLGHTIDRIGAFV